MLAKLVVQCLKLDHIGVIWQGTGILDRPGYDQGPADGSWICGREQADLDVAARVVQLAGVAWYEGGDGCPALDGVSQHQVVIPEELPDRGSKGLAIARVDAGLAGQFV